MRTIKENNGDCESFHLSALTPEYVRQQVRGRRCELQGKVLAGRTVQNSPACGGSNIVISPSTLFVRVRLFLRTARSSLLYLPPHLISVVVFEVGLRRLESPSRLRRDDGGQREARPRPWAGPGGLRARRKQSRRISSIITPWNNLGNVPRVLNKKNTTIINGNWCCNLQYHLIYTFVNCCVM